MNLQIINDWEPTLDYWLQEPTLVDASWLTVYFPCYQAFSFDKKQTVAVKIVYFEGADSETLTGYKNEVVLLKQLHSCPRIITLYDWWVTAKMITMKHLHKVIFSAINIICFNVINFNIS